MESNQFHFCFSHKIVETSFGKHIKRIGERDDNEPRLLTPLFCWSVWFVGRSGLLVGLVCCVLGWLHALLLLLLSLS